MITHNLEKFLLTGRAKLITHTHALGMFGKIPTPKSNVSVITQIQWFPFLNWPQDGDISNCTYNQLFAACEYELKLESDLGVSSFVFRNHLEIFKAGNAAIDLDTTITAAGLKSILLQPAKPIIFDTFITAGQNIKLSILRNEFTNTFANTMGTLSPLATEPLSPNGAGDTNVLLYMAMQDIDGNNVFYSPVGKDWAGSSYALNDRNHDNYTFDVYPNTGSGSQNSALNEPYTNNYYYSTPLINFQIVQINKNFIDTLQ